MTRRTYYLHYDTVCCTLIDEEQRVQTLFVHHQIKEKNNICSYGESVSLRMLASYVHSGIHNGDVLRWLDRVRGEYTIASPHDLVAAFSALNNGTFNI